MQLEKEQQSLYEKIEKNLTPSQDLRKKSKKRTQ
jgi:hypothetical protein